MNRPIVKIANANVFRKQNLVFNNLNLTIEPHQNTAILGANGAGKSTLLKLLSREIYPVERENSVFELFGESRINLWALREKIGVVSQDIQNKYEAIATGLDVVVSAFFGSVGIHGHNQVEPQHIEQAKAIMQKMSISDLADKQYLMLSTGQQRRLLLARALIHNPSALVFDEPTSGLDIKSGFNLINTLRDLVAQEKTLILVTHHINEIIPEIQRVILLKGGEIICDGKKAEVLTAENVSRTFDFPVEISEHKGFYTVTPKVLVK